ncbi:hypothetical protein Rsub_10730 [Raphidocelis subcapitata]|uniref:CRAL-TRIO domain-containing protein n=1 Tax=Raphidocelis subcapitata TaxID=307507 RepID=A0A2V0PCL5_9CHLO|nr:hypothetical protein Rsub_10730 [Raphidocelis subcapitata]|eukprot:GBF97594.1 hypothetical protein Rsub_10730 [Raphidocelis subcapitata]
MSPATEAARPGTDAASAKHSSAAGSWFTHALDKLHITHHAEAAVDLDKLGEEVLASVRAELTAAGAWGDAEAAFCDPACLQRYLRARSMEVTKASAMLKHTLEWRREAAVDNLRLSDYDEFIGEGWMWLAGNDDAGATVLMCRKRRTRLEEDRVENFIGFLTVLLESSVRNMRNGTEKWTWVFDMAGYDSRNSPRIDVTLRVLQLVASHYPERLAKVFILDAPTIFWVLFKAISPFLDPVTKTKIEFVYSKDVKKAEEAARAPARAAAAASGVDAMIELADGPEARFLPYMPFYKAPFDKEALLKKFRSLGWKE